MCNLFCSTLNCADKIILLRELPKLNQDKTDIEVQLVISYAYHNNNIV